jgi:two-component system, LytTR family, sensor histidine kinase AlgZ
MADSVKPRRSFPGRINQFEWAGVAVVLIPAMGVPMALFSLFIPLAAGYICKFTPLDRSVLWRTVLTHVMAAQVLSFLWTLIAGPFARALSYIPQFRGLDKQFSPDLWIVYVTGSLVYLMSIAFQYVVIAQEAARAVELRAVETSMLAREAELRALRAQINPHFLFNSLNSISALTSIDPARAREMCLLLADFLRLTLGMGEKHVIRFSDELDLLEKFMAIEKIRFGERLHMEENIQEEARRCQIPALLLQPLLENAVSHGIASMAEGGQIRLQAQVQDGRLGIVVENDRDDEAPARRKSGVGLKNVRSRLEARYGKDATFRIEPSEDRFRVSMTLPAEYGENP